MDKERAKTKEIDEAEVVSATEMTGFIPSRPGEEEEENYFDVLHYKKQANTKKRI